jgi:hypothetical protein
MTSSTFAALLTDSTPASSKVLAALNDPALAGLLNDEDVLGLMSHWGSKVAYSSSETGRIERPLIIERLMELGANPWKVPELINKWVSSNQVKWVRRSLEMPAEQRSTMSRNWLRESVMENRIEMVALLLDHGAEIKDRAAGVLFNAKSKEMVSLLCARGADMNQTNIVGAFPMVEWMTVAASKDEKLVLASEMACAAANTYLSMGLELSGRGFDLLPFAASLTDARRAAAYGNLTDGRFEAMGIARSKEMVSALSGWAWRVLCCSKDALPTIRDSTALVQQCIRNPNGLLDDDWFLAAAAADVLGASKEHSASRLSDAISQRIERLKIMPSLSKERPEGSRWDDVLGRAAFASHSTYQPTGATNFLSAISRAALKRAIICCMQGRSGIAPISDMAGLNALATRARRNGSTEFIAEITRTAWSQGIPEIFWEKQDYVCPAWFSSADENVVVRDMTRRANAGDRAPSGLTPSSKWPDALKSWMQSHEISQQTVNAPSPSYRPRRM